MAYDKTLELSFEQSLAGGPGAIYSTKHIELSTLPEGTLGSADYGEGNPLYAWFHITESFAGGTSVEFAAVMNATAPGDLTDAVIASTGVIQITHPVLGVSGPLLAGETHHAALTRIDRGAKVPILAGIIRYPAGYKFIQFRYTLLGTFTTGKVTARFTDVHPATGLKIYPAGKLGTISLPVGT